MYPFEESRQEHIQKYGSFLYCPVRDTLCSNMEDEWKTGNKCCRQPCVLDDPDYIAMTKRQEIAVKKRMAKERKSREEEEDAAPIRMQRKTREEMLREKIRRLEKESTEAYRRNRPQIGHEKLNEAMILRGQLRKR